MNCVHDDNKYPVQVGKPEGNDAFGTPGNRWEDNIEMDEIGRCGLNYFY